MVYFCIKYPKLLINSLFSYNLAATTTTTKSISKTTTKTTTKPTLTMTTTKSSIKVTSISYKNSSFNATTSLKMNSSNETPPICLKLILFAHFFCLFAIKISPI